MITLQRSTTPIPPPESAVERVKLGRDGTLSWIAPHGRWVTRHISRLTPADLAQMPDRDRGGIELIRAAWSRQRIDDGSMEDVCSNCCTPGQTRSGDAP